MRADQGIPMRRRSSEVRRANRPANFIWGASTSSYQIEGAAREDGRGPSIWDTFCQAGRVENGDTGDVACDHYHRFAEDIRLMRQLGVDAYRFSVAWPRVLPAGRGNSNEPGLAFYDRLIDSLLRAGIEPWLCLYHWDLPQALEDLGGWANRDSAAWFADYAALVARRYGDRVKRFATFNEPNVFTLFGYGNGSNAPGLADVGLFLRAIHHVNLAHGSAVDVLRGLVFRASIGGIHCCQPAVPHTVADQPAADLLDAYWNGAFPDPQCLGRYPDLLVEKIAPYLQDGDLERIARPVDWFGLNHYSPMFVTSDPAARLGFARAEPPQGIERSGIGWPIVPDAFREMILNVHRRYRLPIYITENGLGGLDELDASGEVADAQRIKYLQLYTGAMDQAIAAGADVRGYFVWSLLDNFEWALGYGPRFGIVYVDYPSQRRIPKASFRWYADRIRASRQNFHPAAR
jgi:beta-glucosidase